MVLEKFLPKSKAPSADYLLGLDIGTEYVKALIAQVKDDQIEIVGAGRAHQELGDMHAGAIADIAGVVKNCEEALAAAEEQAGLQAKRCVIGIAGELVKGVTNTIRYRRPQPDRPLDEAEMEFIMEKSKTERLQRHKSKLRLKLATRT